jgi:hypothetical protein
MMADFTTLDKFRRDRRHHQVVAVRTARGGGKGAEEFRPAVMKIHVTASFFSLSVPVGSCASWQRRDGLMKLWWPER